MALNPSTNATMVGRVTAPNAAYPYGSSKDETAPGAGDGTPYFKARADDIFGFQQALLATAAIVPSGNADRVGASQYLQTLVEIASGRAFNYDESGVVDAYVLNARSGQEAPKTLFDGLVAVFTPGTPNTGAATVNVAGLGVKDIRLKSGIDPGPGAIDGRTTIIYNLFSDWWELRVTTTSAGGLSFDNSTTGLTATDIQAAIDEAIGQDQNRVASAWVNFRAAGGGVISTSYNVSSITDNGTGDFTVNFATPLSSGDYCPVCTGSQPDSAVQNYAVGVRTASEGGPPSTKDANSLRILCQRADGDQVDFREINVLIFGG